MKDLWFIFSAICLGLGLAHMDPLYFIASSLFAIVYSRYEMVKTDVGAIMIGLAKTLGEMKKDEK